MNINQMLQGFVQYFTEGFARIFGASHDDYTEIGIQPFECEPYQQKKDED